MANDKMQAVKEAAEKFNEKAKVILDLGKKMQVSQDNTVKVVSARPTRMAVAQPT